MAIRRQGVKAGEDLEVFKLLFSTMVVEFSIERLKEFTAICIEKHYLNDKQASEVFIELAKRDAKGKGVDWKGIMS